MWHFSFRHIACSSKRPGSVFSSGRSPGSAERQHGGVQEDKRRHVPAHAGESSSQGNNEKLKGCRPPTHTSKMPSGTVYSLRVITVFWIRYILVYILPHHFCSLVKIFVYTDPDSKS